MSAENKLKELFRVYIKSCKTDDYFEEFMKDLYENNETIEPFIDLCRNDAEVGEYFNFVDDEIELYCSLINEVTMEQL